MQYAEILLNQKTRQWDETFSYSIPPEILPKIKIGSYVIVPFRRRSIEGVVVNLKPSIARKLQGKLKSIKKIRQPDWQLSTDELAFGRWLAETYFSSWGEAVFAFLPKAPNKDLQNKSQFQIKPLRRSGPASPESSLDGHHYILWQKDDTRWQDYISVIKRTKQQNKKIAVIFPDMMRLKQFYQLLIKHINPADILVYQGGGKIQPRWEKWLKLRQGEQEIILGTRIAILSPSINLSLIIIDEPNHPGHYEEQTPRYYTSAIAKYWQNKLNVDILEGDIAPNLRQMNEIKQHKAILLKTQDGLSNIQVEMIDMTKERSIISYPLEQALISAKGQKKAVLLFIPRRGFGKITRCMDCEFVYNCPRCNVPLIFHQHDQLVHCHHCNFKEKIPRYCPHCGSVNIKTFGWGTERVAGWLEETFKITPIQLDSEQKLTKIPKQGIFVATQTAFRYNINSDVVVVIGADWLLNQPDFATEELALRTLLRLMMMAKDRLLIQTEQPGLAIFQAIKNRSSQLYFKHLLRERQKFGYPPYGHLIKLTYENKSSAIAEKSALELADKIAKSNLSTTILGPAPAYLPKRRDRYIWQVVLKSQKRLSSKKLRELIDDNWKVTIDPISLL